MTGDLEKEQKEGDLTNPDVVTKYNTAGEITAKALKVVIESIKDGADVYDLCVLGDKVITEECGKVYNKRVKDAVWEEMEKKDDAGRKVDKGISFPTCISVNEIAGHFCPFIKEHTMKIKAGDIVKIDMASHIDGYVGMTAHTVICPKEDGSFPEIADRRADVLRACHTAMDAAVRLMVPGNKAKQIAEAYQKIGKDFKCQFIPGVLSHKLQRFNLDGPTLFGEASAEGQTQGEEIEFQVNDVWGLDIVFSTAEGKVRAVPEAHASVFKREANKTYQMKTAKARQFLSEIQTNFNSFPFSLRQISEESIARIGCSEARRHQLLYEFPILAEKKGEYIAHFKCSVAILPSGIKKLVDVSLVPGGDDSFIKSENSVSDEELKALLSKSLKTNKRRNKKNSQ